MTNIIEKSFTLNGKNIAVVYDLTFYSEKEYKLDFRDFLAYQTKKEKITEPDEIDWKFLYSKELKLAPFNKPKDFLNLDFKKFNLVTYEDFLKITSELFSRVIYQVLKDNPTIMVSDQNEFKVKIILFRVSGREWYMEEDPKKELKGGEYSQFLQELESEEVEHADYLTAGVFLIQTVAAPWFYKRRIDYGYIYRFLVHELEHHKHFMANFYKFEDKVMEKLKIKIQKVPDYRITYVFLTVHQLLNEGIADFVTISNRPTIDIHMEWIFKFKRDLDALTTMVGKNKVHKFWEDNLAYGVYAGGAYYCGKIMCFTIELAFAKRMKKPPFFIALENGKVYDLGEINKVMSKNKVFYVENPDYAVFKRAYEEITKYKYDYRKFIALYEWACRELDIRERNMVMWYGFFDYLKKKATKFYEIFSEKQRAEMYQKIKSIAREKYSV